MASPFPGMDPYLEDPTIWRGFHHSLAEEIRAQLNDHIGPKYYADVEVYTAFEEVNIGMPTTKAVYPDVAVVGPILHEPERGEETTAVATDVATQIAEASSAPIQRAAIAAQTKLRSVRIYLTATDELVTSIEILSPYNKRGEGLAEYRRKRSTLLASSVHLIEIDLLRGGQRAAREVEDPPLENADYVLLVNRHREDTAWRISEIWPVALNEALPVLPVPLLAPDPDVTLDLNAALHAVYQRAGYGWRINYREPVPPPPLRPETENWVAQHVAPAD